MRLNAPTIKHRLVKWIQKNKTCIYAVFKQPILDLETYVVHANGNQKKAGVAVLISDKIDFKIKTVIREKGHYIMIKISIQVEDITIVNIYAPNIGAPQYIRQMLTAIRGEIDSNTIIVGDFNTPITSMETPTRQKINKETLTLNDTLDQMDLIDIYRAFHQKAEYTLFSSAHGTFSMC